MSIFLGDGQGNLGAARDFPSGGTASSAVISSIFNADGNPDLAIAHRNSNNVSVLLGNGRGGFAQPVNYAVGTSPVALVAGDFRNTGNLDLAVVNNGSNNVSVLLGDGRGGFSAARPFAVGLQPTAIAVGDFNQDGNLDLAVVNSGSNTVSVLLGDGQGNFGPATSFNVGIDPRSITAVDFNRNGILDLVVANFGSNDVTILRGDGQGGFSTGLDLDVNDVRPSLVLSGDFNNAGLPSLLTTGYNTTLASLFLPPRPTPAGDYSRLVRNGDGTFTRTLPNGTRINFNAQGLQTSLVDRNGNTTGFTYDADGRLLTITDPVGLVTRLSYASGRLASVQDPAGRITRFSSDPAGNVQSVTDPSGAITRYAYDATNRLIAQTSPRGNTTNYEYNFAGRYTRSRLPDRSTRQLVPAQMAGLVDPASGLGTRDNPAPLTNTTTISSTYTDGRGNRTTSTLDRFGAPTVTRDALNRTTTDERNGHSNPVRTTLPNQVIIARKYDVRGNLLRETNGSINQTTTFTYEPVFNQVTSVRDARGNTTELSYDARGNPVTIRDAVGNTTTTAYNANGLPTSVTDALDSITRFEYDARGNLITRTDSLNRQTRFEYDGAGNPSRITDGEGRVTVFTYDALNRLIRVRDATGGETVYAYEPGRPLISSVTDAANHTTRFAYDEMDRVSRITNPLNQPRTFLYDENGNLKRAVNARNQAITFEYDAANRLLRKVKPEEAVSYGYDAVDNLSSVSNVGSVAVRLGFDYDGGNRVTSASESLTGRRFNYRYDRTDNRVLMDDPQGELIAYSYDALNRLTTLLTSKDQVVRLAYDALSRRTQLDLPNGVSAIYSYDTESQLTGLEHRLGDSVLASFQYTYDRVGNRTTLTELAGQNTFNYDNLSRLMRAVHPQAFNPTETFTYDAVGNRLTSHLSSSYQYNEANRLTQDARFTYSYDADGNLTTKLERAPGRTTTFVYDSENQLTRINFPDGSFTAYAYDGLGRRVQKNVAGTITRYVYDGPNIYLELDGSNTVLARYTHGPRIDQPLIMTRGDQNFYYHPDALGSIQALTDAGGVVVGSYTYDAFGNIVGQTGDLVNPYTYTGRELDAESGLYYYRARYYDPQTGRFISEDPIGFAGGINLYAYVLNNPIRHVDPYGLKCDKDAQLEKALKKLGISPKEYEKSTLQHKKGLVIEAISSRGLPYRPGPINLAPFTRGYIEHSNEARLRRYVIYQANAQGPVIATGGDTNTAVSDIFVVSIRR